MNDLSKNKYDFKQLVFKMFSFNKQSMYTITSKQID